MNPALKADKLA